ncbi:MAG: hypothetical protein R3C53_03710 [Pirellulaceae bacterium]
MTQSNISSKNIKRLQQLASIEDSKFQELRTLVLEIASVLPRKRKRWNTLREQFPALFRFAVGSRLVDHLLDEAGLWPDNDDRLECDIDEINLVLLESSPYEMQA